MLPKNKLNHSESTSLTNLNSINNMMINYNSSNLAASTNQSNKLISHTSSNDERYGCRALICDSNGIIIGETAYRCMICSHINDSIAETKQHYYENHSNEILLGPSANLSNSQNNQCATINGNSNYITNSILNNSLNNSLNNGLQFSSTTSTNSIQQQQHNSNSLLNHDTLTAKKRNVNDVVKKILGSKNVTNNRSTNNSSNFIQSASNLSNYLSQAGQKERDLITGLNNQLNNQLSNQLTNQLNSLNNLNNLTNFNNQMQLAPDDYDDDDLDDQKSEIDQDDWILRNNSMNSINNLGNLSNELIASNNNAAILEAISKSSLCFKLNENANDLANNTISSNNKTNNKSPKLNNLFADNSIDQDVYSNAIYENIMNLSNDSDNKEDLIRAIPPAVKLKRGSTTANVGKPGHVSCAVCGVVRYYSCVYRRYGQFTCQVCYRFFRTFFAKPHRYTCTNLGSCPLDVRVRCRACWIQACINLYTVDGQRKQILDTYRPLNKASEDDNLNTDSNNNSTNLGDLNQSLNNHKHDLDDELEEDRGNKKLKTNNYDVADEQYSNGDDLIEEEDEEEIKQDDQEEPLNYSSTKNASDDDNLKDDEILKF